MQELANFRQQTTTKANYYKKKEEHMPLLRKQLKNKNVRQDEERQKQLLA